MRVWAKQVEQGGERYFEFRSGLSTAHRAFHAHLERNFFEFLAVLVFAVVNRVNQFVNQRVDHVVSCFQGR